VPELDPRVVKVSVEVNGQIRTYESIAIRAVGTKYANSLQNEAQITLTNLKKDVRDDILTETSPYNDNRTPKIVTLEAGRESTGTSIIFKGNVINSVVTQPPDIGLTMKCLTGNFQKGNILARTQPGQASLETIAKQVADDLGVVLDFQATNKNIANYAFTGAALKQVDLLGVAGGVNVFIDDDTLVVKDAYVPLTGQVRELSAKTGMIGIPEFTDRGVRVKFLVDSRTRLGGTLRLRSEEYPVADGNYVIYKLSFEITNREDPFYYIAEAARRSGQ